MDLLLAVAVMDKVAVLLLLMVEKKAVRWSGAGGMVPSSEAWRRLLSSA